jgi:ubiquinone/menaquinone biosynthesis C-methylase UbiE
MRCPTGLIVLRDRQDRYGERSSADDGNASRKGSKQYGKGRGVERSSEQPEGYVLRGGQAGAARLRLINRVKWPTTERLLRTAGLRAGMRVLDLGWGGGGTTLRMAALVGAEGEVVGIDLDQSIVRLARWQAENLAPPVTFRYLDAEAFDEVAAYAFTYARYLMLHLQQLERVFKAMVRALRPGAGSPLRISSTPATSAIHPTLPSIAIWSFTRPRCVPTAQTRRSVRAWWAWRWMPG